jgi:hypothetical protein
MRLIRTSIRLTSTTSRAIGVCRLINTKIKAELNADIVASTSFAKYDGSTTVTYQTRNVTHGPWTRYIVSNNTCGGQIEGSQSYMIPGSHRAIPNLYATAVGTNPFPSSPTRP